MSTNCYMDADLARIVVDQTKFRELVGFLLYLTTSRPDIMFAVFLCARFQSNSKESHFKAVKRFLKYLKGTTSVGLWYPSHSSINLVRYSDFDFAECKLDRNSTSDTCHLLGAIISWHSKKQACVALSTTEAEYIAAGSCWVQILWIKQQLENFRLMVNKVPLLCDNTSAINLTKNQIKYSRTKHIEIRHHFIRDHVSNEDCEIQFIEIDKQLAYIFTKPLPRERFFFLRNELGILDSLFCLCCANLCVSF